MAWSNPIDFQHYRKRCLRKIEAELHNIYNNLIIFNVINLYRDDEDHKLLFDIQIPEQYMNDEDDYRDAIKVKKNRFLFEFDNGKVTWFEQQADCDTKMSYMMYGMRVDND